MRDIDEIWIINQYGITLFNISKEETIDSLLLGGFFSAIKTMLEEMGEEQLKSIILGSSKMLIYNARNGITFISRSKKSIKDKKIEEHIKSVEKEFFEEYGDILDRWNGDTKIFDRFEVKIEDIFKDTPEKRVEKALW